MGGAAWHAKPDRLADPTPEDEDPGNGEAVKRCRRCGLPGTAMTECAVCLRPMRGGALLEFGLSRQGKRAGAILLCESCHLQIAPFDPREGDSLRVEEAS